MCLGEWSKSRRNSPMVHFIWPLRTSNGFGLRCSSLFARLVEAFLNELPSLSVLVTPRWFA